MLNKWSLNHQSSNSVYLVWVFYLKNVFKIAIKNWNLLDPCPKKWGLHFEDIKDVKYTCRKIIIKIQY